MGRQKVSRRSAWWALYLRLRRRQDNKEAGGRPPRNFSHERPPLGERSARIPARRTNTVASRPQRRRESRGERLPPDSSPSRRKEARGSEAGPRSRRPHRRRAAASQRRALRRASSESSAATPRRGERGRERTSPYSPWPRREEAGGSKAEPRSHCPHRHRRRRRAGRQRWAPRRVSSVARGGRQRTEQKDVRRGGKGREGDGNAGGNRATVAGTGDTSRPEHERRPDRATATV